ncbi:prealbumin-like fold domain-containing protein [Arcanobacterium hippocoleae]
MFRLEGPDNRVETVGMSMPGDTFYFQQLSPGKYVLREIRVPNGYPQMDSLIWTFMVESNSADDSKLVVKNFTGSNVNLMPAEKCAHENIKNLNCVDISNKKFQSWRF